MFDTHMLKLDVCHCAACGRYRFVCKTMEANYMPSFLLGVMFSLVLFSVIADAMSQQESASRLPHVSTHTPSIRKQINVNQYIVQL